MFKKSNNNGNGGGVGGGHQMIHDPAQEEAEHVEFNLSNSNSTSCSMFDALKNSNNSRNSNNTCTTIPINSSTSIS